MKKYWWVIVVVFFGVVAAALMFGLRGCNGKGGDISSSVEHISANTDTILGLIRQPIVKTIVKWKTKEVDNNNIVASTVNSSEGNGALFAGNRGIALGNTDATSSGSAGSSDSGYSGNVSSSPNATTFCVYVGSNRFLFWELVNTSNPESIHRLIPNSTGKLANMTLAPGEESSGISYDGNTVKIEIGQMKVWYKRIFGTEMPDDFHPYLRGDKTGWGDREMTRTKGYFALTF